MGLTILFVAIYAAVIANCCIFSDKLQIDNAIQRVATVYLNDVSRWYHKTGLILKKHFSAKFLFVV